MRKPRTLIRMVIRRPRIDLKQSQDNRGRDSSMMQTMDRKPKLIMRGCPRCGGDLHRDMMETDIEYACLQCGRRLTEEKPRKPILDEDWREVA